MASAPPTVVKGNKATKDPDLNVETMCRLCDKKSFKTGSDALLKHYTWEHFKEELDWLSHVLALGLSSCLSLALCLELSLRLVE